MTIRLARPEEVDRVRFVEDDAGLRFAEHDLPGDLEGLDRALLRAGIDAGLLHVLTDDADVPIGFALCQRYPHALHLRELDVLREHQGRGLGTRLLAHTSDLARSLGLRQVTLTTFRDVPFNAPYYRRRGFVDLPEDGLPDWLAAIRRAEAEAGLDRWPRVAMALDL